MADPDYFTTAELRAVPPMQDAGKYPEARILAAAAWVTGIIEREAGVSFVPRAKTRTLSGYGSTSITLPDPFVRSLTTVTVGGVAVDVSGLVFSDGILRFTGAGIWTSGRDNIVVTYSSGYSATPPADIKEAAIAGTRLRLLATNSNSERSARERSITSDAGTITLSVADRDHPTGWPEVDSIITAWRDKLDVFGFA